MAYVTTDDRKYGKGSTSVDIYANVVPYDTNRISYAKVCLQKVGGSTIVINTVRGLQGEADFNNSLDINPSDPRGSYYVAVYWHSSSGSIVAQAKSAEIVLT